MVRPLGLLEAGGAFEDLFRAANSPRTADWNLLNEHRRRLRAWWREFFRDL